VDGLFEDVAESSGESGEFVERDEIVDAVASDAQSGIDDAANSLAAGLEPRGRPRRTRRGA
jgi:hypothetical protein